MSVVFVLAVVVVLLVLMAGLAFLRGAGGALGSTALPSAVLPSTFLLSAGPSGTAPTKVVGSVSGVTPDLGKSFFLLDLLLNLLLDVALATFSIVSVVGVEEGCVAQWNVLAASAVGNLLSVKVSTHTDSLVPVVFINKDDNLLTIKSNVVLGGQNLDTTRWVGLDAGNPVIAFRALSLLANGEWKRDSLSVDDGGDIIGRLNLGEACTGCAALTSKLNLGLRKDKLQFHVVGSNVLGKDGHGVLT